MAKRSEDRLADVMALHEELDASIEPLLALHADRLQCRRGCAGCCVDDINVYELEADRIREQCAEVLESEPHPPGACAFVSPEGACRIYQQRPNVCRTQGLPLRWFAEDTAGEIVELRDICPLNESETPLETLPDESCWLLGPTEGHIALLQSNRDAGAPRRVALRDLFQRTKLK